LVFEPSQENHQETSEKRQKRRTLNCIKVVSQFYVFKAEREKLAEQTESVQRDKEQLDSE
jgi:hypothetical protein